MVSKNIYYVIMYMNPNTGFFESLPAAKLYQVASTKSAGPAIVFS